MVPPSSSSLDSGDGLGEARQAGDRLQVFGQAYLALELVALCARRREVDGALEVVEGAVVLVDVGEDAGEREVERVVLRRGLERRDEDPLGALPVVREDADLRLGDRVVGPERP